MRCLFIIPDIKSGSGVCVKEVAGLLYNQGHEVVVLTKFIENESSLDMYSYSNSNRKELSFLKSIKRIISYPIWPFISYKEFKAILMKSKELIESKNIDVVIATYNPIESLYAAHMLKYKYHIMYVAYFLDALFAGQKPKFMPERLKMMLALFWEKKVLRNADQVIMMKSAEVAYNRLIAKLPYLKITKFLDLPLYKPIKHQDKNRVHFPQSEVIFFYAGALPRNIRDPKFFLEFFSKYAGPNHHLYLAGSGDYDQILEYYATNNRNIHILGSVPHSIAKEMYIEADFLVNIGNTLNYMVPSKIFEYMSVAKPIIATKKIKDDPSSVYYDRYPSVLVLEENMEINQKDQFLNFINTAVTSFNEIDDFILNRPETFANCLETAYEEFNRC